MQASMQMEPPEASRTALIATMDDVVAVAAESKLLSSRYPEIRRVSCGFREGTLTLRGQVSRYYLKQIAQSVVSQLVGVVEIDNQVHVVARHDPIETGLPRVSASR